jgi:hypothetical protein
LIDNATSNTDLKADDSAKNRKNGEKIVASKRVNTLSFYTTNFKILQSSGDDKSSIKSKNGSVKSKSNGLLAENVSL